MEEAKHICVYSGSAYPELSQQIANYLQINLGKVHILASLRKRSSISTNNFSGLLGNSFFFFFLQGNISLNLNES